MKLVVRVLPGQHIAQRLCRSQRFSFGQEEPNLVVASRVAIARTVRLNPREVAHWSKAQLLPSRHELVNGKDSRAFQNCHGAVATSVRPGYSLFRMGIGY